MLHAVLKRVVCAAPALVLAFAAGAALAETSRTTPAPRAMPAPRAALTEEQIRAAQASAGEIVEQSLRAAQQGLERYRDLGESARRRADDIADTALAQSRQEVLDFLGIDARANASLYYFVSYNMPLPMLRAYAVEAMWAGGTLVLRGVPPGKTLAKFVTEDLRELVYDKGAAAAISIDPRLFDAYQVKLVPAIVFTTERSNFECAGRNPVPFVHRGQSLSYDTCPPVDPSRYWKMTGAVTTDYALREFVDAGAEGARAHLTALAKGLATGEGTPKLQQPFAGAWKSALSPDDVMAASRGAQTAGQAPGATR
jgi:type-F conjugative transfer system pilin assembly protein TrbC